MTEDDFTTPQKRGSLSRLSSIALPTVPLATLALDAVNYFTGGTVLTWLLIFFLYVCSGAVGARIFGRQDRLHAVVYGIVVGVVLSFVSLVIKGLLAIALGAPSAGLIAGLLDVAKRLFMLLGLSGELVNFLSTVPYFCVCGPIQCGIGGIIAGLGGLIYGLKRRPDPDRFSSLDQ